MNFPERVPRNALRLINVMVESERRVNHSADALSLTILVLRYAFKYAYASGNFFLFHAFFYHDRLEVNLIH